ncbi:MAG: amidohydrolase family protein [Alphaproteobacteria bacterium]
MIIDTHSHFMAPSLIGHLRTRTELPYIRNDKSGVARTYSHTSAFPLKAEQQDLGRRREFMDRFGITHQIMSFPGLLGIDAGPVDVAAPVLRAANEDLAKVCRDEPQRFSGLAGLPYADLNAARKELTHCCQILGLKGAIVPARYFESLETAQYLTPLLEVANELGAHLLVHPGFRAGESPAGKFTDNHNHRFSSLAIQNEVSHAVVTLAMTDLLDPFPDLTIQVINLGGVIPFLLERMDHVARTRTPDAPIPSERIRRLYVDNASLGPRALSLAIETFGADRIMIGTDFPVFTSDDSIAAVRALDLNHNQSESILAGNAAKIFTLKLAA